MVVIDTWHCYRAAVSHHGLILYGGTAGGGYVTLRAGKGANVWTYMPVCLFSPVEIFSTVVI